MYDAVRKEGWRVNDARIPRGVEAQRATRLATTTARWRSSARLISQALRRLPHVPKFICLCQGINEQGHEWEKGSP
jgi:hypothetical protein